MAIGGGGAIAQAAVELVADGSKIRPSVKQALVGAGGEAEAASASLGQRIGGKIGGGISSALGKAAGFALAAAGLHKVIETGVEYQGVMNRLGAVTQASAQDMAAAGQLAQAMGRDMRYPGVTASDAADAMLDLAKAGFDLKSSMQAAGPVLNLVTASGLDTARVAQITGDMMDVWSLKADSAARVTDILGAAVNNSSGDLNTMYDALKYVGPVAHGLGINLHDTATAIAELGKNGIIGSQAGTILRSMMTSLANPSKQAAQALQNLGVQAFDSSGKFVGMRAVIGQLHDAQGRMTQQQFAANSAMAFGQEAMSGVIALANHGTDAWDHMSDALNRQGAAAQIAQAQTQGFGAVLGNLRKVAADVSLQLFQAVAPALTSIGSALVSGLQNLGPILAALLRPAMSALSTIGQVASAVLGPALGFIMHLVQQLGAVMNTPAFSVFAAAIGGAAAAFALLKTPMLIVTAALRVWATAAKVATAAQIALNIAMDANPIGLIVIAIGALVGAFVYLWNNSAGFRDFWIGLWNAVKSAVSAAVSWVSGALTSVGNFFTSVGSAISSGVSAILNWFVALPGRIGSFLASLPGILWNAFTSALQFGLNAVIQGLQWIIAEVIAFPMQVLWALGQLGVLLWQALSAAWQWALNATVQGVSWLINFVVSLPGRILAAIVALGSMLAGWASAAWNWAVSATVSAAQGIFNFVISLPGRIVSGLATLGGMLRNAASTAWNAFVNGMTSAAEAIWGFVKSIPGRIWSALGDLGGLLLGAGKAIINGLLNGLKNAVGAVWDFVKGIGSKIASLKGPLPKDRVLLVPAGKAIIAGLDRGLRSEFGTVRSTLRQFTKEIPGLDAKIEASATHDVRGAAELANAYRSAYAHAAVAKSSSRTTHREVHAPITVVSSASDPLIVARYAADRVARMAQA